MTLIEQIQNFKVFEVGTFVIYNNKLFKIESLPGYKYKWCDEYYFSVNWDDVRGSWERVGYGVSCVNADELHYSCLNLFANIEIFNPDDDFSLIPQFEKLQLLLAKKQIDAELWKMKNAK